MNNKHHGGVWSITLSTQTEPPRDDWVVRVSLTIITAKSYMFSATLTQHIIYRKTLLQTGMNKAFLKTFNETNFSSLKHKMRLKRAWHSINITKYKVTRVTDFCKND